LHSLTAQLAAMEAVAHSLLRQLTGKDRVGTLEQVLAHLNAAVHRARRENRISKTTAARLISFSASARHKIKMSDHELKLVLHCLSAKYHSRVEPPPKIDRKNFPPMAPKMPAIQLPPTSCDAPAPSVASLSDAQEAPPPPNPPPTPAIQMMQPPQPMMPVHAATVNCWYQHRSGTMYFGMPPAGGVVRQGTIVNGELVEM